jgi:predicted GNAT family N-acyltransferase
MRRDIASRRKAERQEMEEVIVCRQLPTAREYIDLRAKMGWGAIDEEIAVKTLQAAAFTVCLRSNGRLIGLARVMGDDVMYFFLADLIIDSEFRGGGHGDRLMREVTAYFDRSAQPGATITLIAVSGRESFYQRYGFVRCPDGPFGAGMRYVPPVPQ